MIHIVSLSVDTKDIVEVTPNSVSQVTMRKQMINHLYLSIRAAAALRSKINSNLLKVSIDRQTIIDDFLNQNATSSRQVSVPNVIQQRPRIVHNLMLLFPLLDVECTIVCKLPTDKIIAINTIIQQSTNFWLDQFPYRRAMLTNLLSCSSLRCAIFLLKNECTKRVTLYEVPR